VSKEKIIETFKDEIVQKITNETKEILTTEKEKKEIETFFKKCHTLLRDKEGIVTMDALNNLSMLLFLRLVNNHVKDGTIDLLNIEEYRSIPEDKKSLIQYVLFDNIIENGIFKVEIGKIPSIITFIFKMIIQHHPKTKDIFHDRYPQIKNQSTYEAIFKMMSKINWDEMETDIKGIAYEHFLSSELTGGDLGQFFTKREVIDYIVNEINPQLNENFIDPAMGTGGFIIRMFNKVKHLYIDNNIPLNQEKISEIINGVEKNPSTAVLALNNCLVTTGQIPTNVINDDSIRNFYDNKKNVLIPNKYDIVVANPPFGIDGLDYNDFPSVYGDSDKDSEKKITKKDFLPIESNDAVCLFLQAIYCMLKDGGRAGIIIPDGKQMSNTKTNMFKEIRQFLVEKCNIYKIVKLPSGTFLPYAGVETMVLFFKKGQQTKKIDFYKMNSNYTTDEKTISVEYEKIKSNKYILSINHYVNTNDNILVSGITSYPLSHIFEEVKKTKPTNDNEEYYTCKVKLWYKGIEQCEKINFETAKSIFKIHENNIIFSKINAKKGSICIVSKNDTNNLISGDYYQYKIKDIINQKYLWYYIKLTNFHEVLLKYSGGAVGGKERLKSSFVDKIKIPVPPLTIQQKIIEELDAIYNTIEGLNESLDNMKQIKKTQFSNIVGNKKICKKKLEDITTINIGGTPSRKIPEYFEGTNKWVQISDMNTKYISDTKEKITDDGVNNSNVKLIKKGNILLSFKLSIGKIAFADDTMYCNEAIAFFEGNDEVLTKYLYTYFENTNITGGSSGCIGGGSLNKEKLNNLVISYPSLEDQEKIIKEMEELDVFEEQTKKLIKNLNKQAKETLERHLNSCKKQENPIKQYNEIMKQLGKPEIIDDDNTEELENKFASLEADFESLTGNNLSELLKESEDDSYQDEPNDNEPTSDNDEEYNKTITIKPKQKKAEEKDIFDE